MRIQIRWYPRARSEKKMIYFESVQSESIIIRDLNKSKVTVKIIRQLFFTLPWLFVDIYALYYKCSISSLFKYFVSKYSPPTIHFI